jgi:F0F1-type ATP synthase membrane subunit c/vacuolar-type H+-ATPase subunit K
VRKIKMKNLKRVSAILILVIILGILSSSVYAATKTITSDDLDATKNEIMTEIDSVKAEQQNLQTAQNELSEQVSSSEEDGELSTGIGLIAAALATGLGCIGAGIAVAVVASSAVGAISENPSLLGKTIIFAGLAEGIAIYGLIISIMILSKI